MSIFCKEKIGAISILLFCFKWSFFLITFKKDHVSKECQNFPIDCTLCDKKGIPRGKLREHHDPVVGECEGSQAVCPFVSMGCASREVKKNTQLNQKGLQYLYIRLSSLVEREQKKKRLHKSDLRYDKLWQTARGLFNFRNWYGHCACVRCWPNAGGLALFLTLII